MSDPFNSVTLLRIIQEGETDAHSPVSEELMSQLRENWEVLTMLFGYTGDSGTATSNPPNDATGVLTDTGAAYDADEHNGRSLVMIDGTAAGNIYTIDDTTATTIVCTGDNLYSDGVRSGDAYKVFYNLKNTVGHTHDGVDSSKEQMCHIDVDTYTGDGGSDPGTGAAQAITGVGFAPQIVKIIVQDQADSELYQRITGMVADYSQNMSDAGFDQYSINSLDADGFTVDDSNTDDHPNKNGETYLYIALG